MRKLVMTWVFCLATAFLFAQQVNNEERIAQLPALIEKAAEQGDFDEAGKLQRELRIREDMREAVLQKNYERAGELQRELDGRPAPDQKVNQTTVTTVQTTPVNQSSSRDFDPRKKFMLYVDFSPLGLSLFSYNTYEYDWQTGLSYPVAETRARFSLNLKLGNRFYFSKAEGRKLRVGIDVNYLSLNIAPSLAELPNLTFSLVRPGVVLNSFLTEDMGIDFQFNGGLMTSFSDYIGFAQPGFSLNPQVKYWYKKLSVGLEYNFGLMPKDDLRIQYIGVSIGIRK
jgi:hypothetical protein